jgi:polyhydroxybutyrate depolymerase
VRATKALRAGAFAAFSIGAPFGCTKRIDEPRPGRTQEPSAAPTTAVAPSSPTGSSAPRRVELVNADLVVPDRADAAKPMPFLLVLHGLGDRGSHFAERIGLAELARKRRFAYAAPDGSLDPINRRFWNAWHACCDFDQLGPDHVQALSELLDRASRHPAVDPRRRYVLGFSNGGFMAHRLACDVGGLAAVASIAGAGPSPGEACRAPTATAVLQVHGDLDVVIAYSGGHSLNDPKLPRHPSASDTVSGWVKRNRCSQPESARLTLDLESALPGKETSVLRHAGCNRSVELWTVKGGEHVIATEPTALEHVIAFLERHTAP